jgi:hypothetical protein
MPRDRIVEFYSGRPDDRQRTLDQILAQPDRWLEHEHDYIQWVFPTAARSSVNPSAPLITADTAAAFAADPALRERLRAAFVRMLSFYGLRLRDGNVEIDPERFAVRSAAWLRPYNHNHLRLTRIMQSLAALGLRGEAQSLQRCLLTDVTTPEPSGLVARETLDYWRDAVS